ncbi:hypothetical protein BA6E_125523 [Bacteroidales bacterium 6E]|nr:hypothetical protein BA6E_125523 [Bacteroidales bacterium 6E]
MGYLKMGCKVKLMLISVKIGYSVGGTKVNNNVV